MHSKHHRVPMYGILTAALLLGSAATAVPAAAAADPAPIGAHQYFTGVVNGASEKAVVKVACPGPVGGDTTGHPVSGQSVYVTPAASTEGTSTGYTGEAATGVVVDFGVPSTSMPLVLKSYGTKADIPTTLNLPCDGTGKVVFTPAPTSSTAWPSTVLVTYQNIAV